MTIIRSNYCSMVLELQKRGIRRVDGILLDLGVSSYQLDNAGRGFSYREDAPLDMRMDQRQEKTAADIVNGYSEGELYRIIRITERTSLRKTLQSISVWQGRRRPSVPPGSCQRL